MFGMLGFLNFLDCNFVIGDAEDGGGTDDGLLSPSLVALPLEVSRDNDFLAEANFFGSFGAMMILSIYFQFSVNPMTTVPTAAQIWYHAIRDMIYNYWWKTREK